MRARAILLSSLLVACGGTSPPSFAMPETRLANEKIRSTPATTCSENRIYDVERGCQTPSWGVPVFVEHRSSMSDHYQLEGAAFALDGELLFDTNDPELLKKKRFPVFATNVRSGEHELRVLLVYRGNGYGIFSYLRGYRFQTTQAHVFRAASGDVRLRSVGFEQGERSVEERPSILFQSW